jgi:hypothetical protein
MAEQSTMDADVLAAVAFPWIQEELAHFLQDQINHTAGRSSMNLIYRTRAM